MSSTILLPRTRKPSKPPNRPKPTTKGCHRCSNPYYIPSVHMCFACLTYTIDLERAVMLYEYAAGGDNRK